MFTDALNNKYKKGFTLIEIMVVMGILGLLAISGLTSYLNTRRVSRDARRKADLEQIRSALELYRSDNFNYPDVLAGSTDNYLKPVLTSPVPYTNPNTFPIDPQSNSGYFYYYQRNPSNANEYQICAFLENKLASDPDCPIIPIPLCNSATDSCNYGVSQP